MTDQNVTDKTNELLANAIDFVERSGDFIAEQAPLVVQEFLTYRFIEACLAAVGSGLCILVCAVVGTYLFRIAYKELKAKGIDDAKPEVAVPPVVVCTVLLFACAFLTTDLLIPYAADAIKIQVAPRVYLIEELPKLIKG